MKVEDIIEEVHEVVNDVEEHKSVKKSKKHKNDKK